MVVPGDKNRSHLVRDAVAKKNNSPCNDTAKAVELRCGRRVLIEFYCSTCRHYLDVKINVGVNGNHVIVCPCGHRHFRYVHRGVITSDRWFEGQVVADEILVMKSARHREPRERGKVAVIREMEAVGLLK